MNVLVLGQICSGTVDVSGLSLREYDEWIATADKYLKSLRPPDSARDWFEANSVSEF